jgi:PqqA peptide cyclase
MPSTEGPAKPLSLVAELTHRCPLGCPYCCNPLALESHDEELDAATWAQLFRDAAALGVRHAHLSGGEPGARRDLVDIAAHAREAGLSTRLITSGVGIATRTMRDLWEAGLEHIQVSFQDSDAVSSDHIAGHRGAFQRKCAVAAEAVRLGLPLTVELVVHRANIGRIADMVGLALGLGAERIGLVRVRDHGWAQRNRAALTPSAAQVERAVAEIDELRRTHQGRIVIDANMSGAESWDGRSLVITPSGRALPGLAAQPILGLESWSVRDHSLADIWTRSPVFSVFRKAEVRPDPGADCALHGTGAASDPAAVQDDYVHRRM